MALLSPFQRGLSLHTAAWEPLLSSPASSLLLGAHRRFSACARCVGGKDWWFWFLLCELYLRTFFFIGGSMAPSRLHPLSVVHFQSTLFQTKGQNLIVPVVSFFLRCHPVRPTRPGCPYSLLDLQRSLIGSLASFRHNHFLVTLRTLSPLLPSANYASRVALRQRKRKRVRSGYRRLPRRRTRGPGVGE